METREKGRRRKGGLRRMKNRCELVLCVARREGKGNKKERRVMMNKA